MLTYCYVDGHNLYKGRTEKTGYRWLDIRRLFEVVLPSPHEIGRVKFFTSEVKDKIKLDRQLTYLNALEGRGGIEIERGRYEHKTKAASLKHVLLHGKKITPSKLGVEKKIDGLSLTFLEEKETDVRLAINITLNCCLEKFDCVALLSIDTDFLPVLDLARNKFKKQTIVISPNNKISHLLRNTVDEYKHITDGDLKKSILPTSFKDSKGNEHRKPHGW